MTAANAEARHMSPTLAVGSLDARTLRVLEFRSRRGPHLRRGWFMRRILLATDTVALVVAFSAAVAMTGTADAVATRAEFALFALTLPLWFAAAKLHGLYAHDESRAGHSTVTEFRSVLQVVTLGTWIVFGASWLAGMASPAPLHLVLFWALAIVLLIAFRAIARTAIRDRTGYLQNAVIFGAGEVGQLVARKLLHHHEYGINVVGFVDADPKSRRADLGHLSVLGGPESLPDVIELLDVERVIVAFSNEPDRETVEVLRSLRQLDIHVDLVPRLFQLVGPNVALHDVEGLPLMGLPPVRLTRSGRFLKRTLDIVGSAALLVVTAPLFAYIAWRIKRDSPGPIFFRQIRLGMNMKEFTALKFRTMALDADDAVHREYIRSTMSASAVAGKNGIYKLERRDAVTKVGGWLRRTSLDELPQLINVLRGDMSLVGPRPCIPYETEHFQAHHFDRFLVPSGLTGLWQVKARAQSTFGEALELDVAYARGWSVALDLELLFRTPFAILNQRKVTA